MKMICDVPDEVIKCIKDGTWCGSSVAEKMIANGTPLMEIVEVLEDIKAEIDTYLQAEDFGSEYRKDVAQIIDKHISAEGSDKE